MIKKKPDLRYLLSVIETKLTELDVVRLAAAASALELAAKDTGKRGRTRDEAKALVMKTGIAEEYVDEALRKGLYLPQMDLLKAFDGKKEESWKKVRAWADYFMDGGAGYKIRKFRQIAEQGLDLSIFLNVRKSELDLDVAEGDDRFYHLTAVRGFHDLKRHADQETVGYRRARSPLPGTKLYINPSQDMSEREYVPLKEFVAEVFNDMYGNDRSLQILRHLHEFPHVIQKDMQRRMKMLDRR